MTEDATGNRQVYGEFPVCPTLLVSFDETGDHALEACLSRIGRLPESTIYRRHVLAVSWRERPGKDVSQPEPCLDFSDDSWKILGDDVPQTDNLWASLEFPFTNRIKAGLLRPSSRHGLGLLNQEYYLTPTTLTVFVVGTLQAPPKYHQMVRRLRKYLDATILVREINWFSLVELPTSSVEKESWPALIRDAFPSVSTEKYVDHCFVVSQWDHWGIPLEHDGEMATIMGNILAHFLATDQWHSEGFLAQRTRIIGDTQPSRVSVLGISRIVPIQHELSTSGLDLAAKISSLWYEPFDGEGDRLNLLVKEMVAQAQQEVESLVQSLPEWSGRREEVRQRPLTDQVTWARQQLDLSERDHKTWLATKREQLETGRQNFSNSFRAIVLDIVRFYGGFGHISGIREKLWEELQKISAQQDSLSPGRPENTFVDRSIDRTFRSINTLLPHLAESGPAAFWVFVAILASLLILVAPSDPVFKLSPLQVVYISFVIAAIFYGAAAIPGVLFARRQNQLFDHARKYHAALNAFYQYRGAQSYLRKAIQDLRQDRAFEQLAELPALFRNPPPEDRHQSDGETIPISLLPGNAVPLTSRDYEIETTGAPPKESPFNDRDLYSWFMSAVGFENYIGSTFTGDGNISLDEEALRAATLEFANSLLTNAVSQSNVEHQPEWNISFPQYQIWETAASPLLPIPMARHMSAQSSLSVSGPLDLLHQLESHLPAGQKLNLTTSRFPNELNLLAEIPLIASAMGADDPDESND